MENNENKEVTPKVEYKNFGIKRERRRRPKGVFSFVIIAAILALVVMVANLVLDNALLGMFKANSMNAETVILDGINFWGIEVDQYDNKNAAMAGSRDVIKKGGAGYILVEEGQPFRVLCCVYCEKAESDAEWGTISETDMPNARIREFKAESREVSIACCHDREMFVALAKSFTENFDELCKRLIDFKEKKTTAKDISGWALFTYNNLQQRVLEFGTIQENAMSEVYAKVLLQVNKQLLALYQLAYEGESTNYISVLKNTMCAVAFSYVELLAA